MSAHNKEDVIICDCISRYPALRAVLGVLLLAVWLVGCGSSGGDASPAATTPQSESPTNPPSTPNDPNPSDPSEPDPPAQDPVPPPAAGTAQLSWDISTDPQVAGYRVYFGDASGKYQQALGAGIAVAGNSYSVTGLSGGKRYYFAVTSEDADGNESGFSQEVIRDVP
jgi:hypothetical protein